MGKMWLIMCNLYESGDSQVQDQVQLEYYKLYNLLGRLDHTVFLGGRSPASVPALLGPRLSGRVTVCQYHSIRLLFMK